MEESKAIINKFDGNDFGFWRMQIEDILYQKGLHRPLEGVKPEDMSQADWNLLDRQALGVVRLTLARNVAFNIMEEKTTAGLMKTLTDMYEKPSAANKVYLMRRLFNLKMSEGASVTDHINEFNQITSQLNSVEISFEDEVRALILLSSLPESWNATVTAVSSSCGSNRLKFEEVRNLILSEDVRQRESNENLNSALDVHEDRRRTTGRKFRGSRPDRSCWNCGKHGHLRRDCKSPKKQQGRITGDLSEGTNVADGSDSDVMVLSLPTGDESWVIDSGATFHATSQKTILGRYQEGDFGTVYLGDGSPCKTDGRGCTKVKAENGTLLELDDVRYVPKLKSNLISVGQLACRGYRTTFMAGRWEISKGMQVVASGWKVGGLYVLNRSSGRVKGKQRGSFSKIQPNQCDLARRPTREEALQARTRCEWERAKDSEMKPLKQQWDLKGLPMKAPETRWVYRPKKQIGKVLVDLETSGSSAMKELKRSSASAGLWP